MLFLKVRKRDELDILIGTAIYRLPEMLEMSVI